MSCKVKALISFLIFIHDVFFYFLFFHVTRYSKVNKSEDSWSHLLELGWVKVTNLLPDTIYKDVLVPQDVGNLERQVALRIFCRVKQPGMIVYA